MLTTEVMTLSQEVIDRFRSSLYAKGRPTSTVKAYCSDLQVLLLDSGVEQISVEQFEETAALWLTRNRRIVAPKTTGRRLTSLRVFIKWAKWSPMLEDYGAPTPPKGLPHPLPEGIAGVYRLAQVAESAAQRALVALLGMEGLRITEALEARPSHIDMHEMMLTVRGKGDKTRRVPIGPKSWAMMEEAVVRAFVAGDELIVGFKDRFARALISRLGEKAQLARHIATHDLRATFATHVYNVTKDARVVQELLGHSSGQQTELYIEVAIGKLKAAVSDL